MKGKGLVNHLINHLPVELHLPGYNYCGPGTRLNERLARGDKGVNKLDEACKQHDIAYSESNNIADRHIADTVLMNIAKQRSVSKDAKIGEKVASTLVNKIMKAKLKLGAGYKNFNSCVSKIRSKLKKHKPKNSKSAIKFALLAAKKLITKGGHSELPRIIPLPKTGGILPLIPLLAGLSALGSIAGGSAAIAKTVNDYKSAQKSLKEAERHNKTMEAIAVGKGLYIIPYKNGYGLHIKKTKN